MTTSLYHDIAATTAELREAKDSLANQRAKTEQEAIDRAGGPKTLGANEEERQRKLALALSRDAVYLAAHRRVRFLEAQLDTQQAGLALEQDTRRETEWAIRSKIAQALTHQARDLDTSAETTALDQAADRAQERNPLL